MIRKYAIVLKSPMGPKNGFISIYDEEGVAEGYLECLGKRHVFSGNIVEEGTTTMVLQGIFQSPLGEEPFIIEGEVTEKQLAGKFIRHEDCYEIVGTNSIV